jgi:hypothetical protein
MFDNFYIVLGSIFIPIIYLYILKIPYWFEFYSGYKLMKPFDCGFCLSFWISLFFLNLQNNFIHSLFISSSVPFIYLFIENKITNKWEF